MSLKLDGRKLAKELEDRLQFEIASGLSKAGRPPGLAVIRVGEDPASGVYVSNKEKACARIGVASFGTHLPSTTPLPEVIQKIQALNANEKVDGILVQLPLPAGIDSTSLLMSIDPEKDADGLHTLNLGKLLKGESGPRSCTPAGIMALLSTNGISVEGKRAVVVGRSILVGQPMALMLQSANATVTVAHSKTKDLIDLTRQAELLVVAAGRPQIIGRDHVRSNAVVIDVGIHRLPCVGLEEQPQKPKLCGDVCFNEVASKVAAITPVPGGVGPMTVAMLLVNTVSRWQQHCGLSFNLGDLLP
ncbi:bifunctional methylenetetrahydrofolate dehydrogenase/methenyltetrahydrofolate cyclohydrolase FolD [Prochlorococcus sp. MIT 1307]|uniref:bifunctional methylenetetrahydrofolate dehydrogenase/methenyltetrahydrofolate cyclohydrolase FolD n=1 Tax=Prochlorococcus sp. MIT 1307 TaxID=3096219 RepID=UPI002A74D874|nr:bifunctional methylenetetrahydrofolate dehydrogenase/methenyltetrahydrofolate cyclohydrolase FolD [Prochlorococcus sp. MIT 1307]